jgi:hypothetical protein
MLAKKPITMGGMNHHNPIYKKPCPLSRKLTIVLTNTEGHADHHASLAYSRKEDSD